jgi:hypothetical protein
VSSTVQIVLDAVDADLLADFWAAALGYQRYGAFEQYRSIVDPAGAGPKMIIQQVPEPRRAKNRMHLDVHHADVPGEVERLEGLGARRTDVEPIAEAGTSWVRMVDPEGNEFCVCRLAG